MFSTPDSVPYWTIAEVFKDDDFNQHTIHADIITFDLYIREHIINVLEEKMIMYIFDQEKETMTFYSVNHLRRIIERFCASNKEIIDFPYVIEHFYKKIKPYFDWRQVSYFEEAFVKYIEPQKEYTFDHKDIVFEYLPKRSNMLWSFNGDDDRSDHKIWFDCRRLVTNGNYYLSLLDICAQFVSLNNRSRNIRWNSLKFFFDGPPYNMIIYLERNVPHEQLKLEDIAAIFREKSVYWFDVHVGKSKIAQSPVLYTYNIRC